MSPKKPGRSLLDRLAGEHVAVHCVGEDLLKGRCAAGIIVIDACVTDIDIDRIRGNVDEDHRHGKLAFDQALGVAFK